MWTVESKPLENGRVAHFNIQRNGSPAKFSAVLSAWQHDPAFRSWFIQLLAASPFRAFRWETPPITASSADRPFEFVLLDAPYLAVEPDPNAFRKHFGNRPSTDAVVSFPNLGGDAVLVVPCPSGPTSAYGHLAAFLREAPEAQKHALWSLVGAETEQALGGSPLWLSTAGAGVAWLHVRLDERPKYYGFAPYRDTKP
jgi:uncharacterized protein DUF6940